MLLPLDIQERESIPWQSFVDYLSTIRNTPFGLLTGGRAVAIGAFFVISRLPVSAEVYPSPTSNQHRDFSWRVKVATTGARRSLTTDYTKEALENCAYTANGMAAPVRPADCLMKNDETNPFVEAKKWRKP